MTKQKLRDKFFKECVDSFEGQLPKVNLTPHNMFEWIWGNTNSITETPKSESIPVSKLEYWRLNYSDICTWEEFNSLWFYCSKCRSYQEGMCICYAR